MRKHFPLKTYLKMPLIKKQPNALKILWCGILVLSRELSNYVLTDIAFIASHTNSHWRTISPRPPQYPQRGERAGSMGPASKKPMLQGEKFFNIIFLNISIKN